MTESYQYHLSLIGRNYYCKRGDKNLSKNKILKCFFVFFVLNFLLYFSIPSQIILPEHSQLSIKALPIGSFCQLTEECSTTIEKADNSVRINSQNAGEYEYSYRLFNTIPIKQVNVSVVPKRYVIPSGETIGVKIYTKGLLVIDVSAVYAKDMTEHFPARDAGIAVGDRIMSVDGIELKTNEEFAQYINSVKTKVKLKIARDDTEFETEITPVMSNDNDIYKVGLWVRDSTAGIGTLTCYDLQTGEYAALGHAICDSDTGEIMTVSNGGLINCKVVSIQKAQSGKPGELTGAFSKESVGSISENNEFGIYGTLNEEYIDMSKKPIEAATRFQVKEGEAQILCDVDGNGVKSYSVDIVKISKSDVIDNKGIVIKVTDNELLEKTGGIVQGMSGSPIIQNGRIVGAVTHVFVNDPTRGYGIFIENMLSEAEKIK